jgi:hypothetical protein
MRVCSRRGSCQFPNDRFEDIANFGMFRILNDASLDRSTWRAK